MQRILALAALFSFAALAGAQTPAWVARSNRISEEVMRDRAQFFPEAPSSSGQEEFDTQVARAAVRLHGRARRVDGAGYLRVQQRQRRRLGAVRGNLDAAPHEAPGQATAYCYGYLQLRSLRTRAEIALGPRFDLMAFNDFIIAQGLLPPRVLERAVMEEFVRERSGKPTP